MPGSDQHGEEVHAECGAGRLRLRGQDHRAAGRPHRAGPAGSQGHQPGQSRWGAAVIVATILVL